MTETSMYHDAARTSLLGTRIVAWGWLFFMVVSVSSFFVSIWLPLWGYNTAGPSALSAMMMAVAFFTRPRPVEIEINARNNNDNS